MIVGTEVVAILGTINAFLLGGILTFQMKIWDHLTNAKDGITKKRDISDCEKEQAKCFGMFSKKIDGLYKEGARLCHEDEKLWDELNSHSHTGLSPDSKVTR